MSRPLVMQAAKELSRDDILHVLKGMKVDLDADTKLSLSRLQNRLDRALDAAQGLPRLFPEIDAGIDPSGLPVWNEGAPIGETFKHSVLDDMLTPHVIEDPRQGVFPWFITLLPMIAQDIDEDEDKIGYVYFFSMAKDEYNDLIMKIVGVYRTKENTPLLLVEYTPIWADSEAEHKSRTESAGLKGRFGLRYSATAFEQKFFLNILERNRKHLTKGLQKSTGSSRFSFILPIVPLNMQAIVRMSKDSGCVVCGKGTKHTCGACHLVQYCGKECQRQDWKNHKPSCKPLASAKWYNVAFSSSPVPITGGKNLFVSSINRHDNLKKWDPEALKEEKGTELMVPPNSDKDILLKFQIGVGGGRPQHMLVYDQNKSCHMFLLAQQSKEAFDAAIKAIGNDLKMYRWGRRVNQWDWKICFERVPKRNPPW